LSDLVILKNTYEWWEMALEGNLNVQTLVGFLIRVQAPARPESVSIPGVSRVLRDCPQSS
jgi:hypothetical protein